MDVFLVLGLVAIVSASLATSWLIQRMRKLTWIRQHRLVYVSGAENRYPQLPLGNYGLPLETKTTDGFLRVKVVFPRLTEAGDVEYIYSWHYLQNVAIVQMRLNQRVKVKFSFANDIAPVIQEHLQIDREIEQLNQKYAQLNQLANLIATSDLYATKIDLYERAINQVETLLSQAATLENIYVRLIRETLIGAKISQFDADSLTTRSINFLEQYQQVKESYLRLKDEATAYLELANRRA